MFKRDKPLFSRPVLAAIIVLSTLAVWLLNLTSPKIELDKPHIETWQTASGIPVYWIYQDAWAGSDKVELAIIFNDVANDSSLTQQTLALLTGPTLPLSTATINQRLTPIAAQVETYYSKQQQQINITLSNRPQFLSATLGLLNTWFNQTQFKELAVQRSAGYSQQDLGYQQLMLQLFNTPSSETSTSVTSTSAAQLDQHFMALKQQVSHIVIAGALDNDAQKLLAQGLQQITQTMQPAVSPKALPLASQPAISELGTKALSAFYGAIALNPLSSATDWLTLQIWAKDSLETQKTQFQSQAAQWKLNLAPPQAFVTWQLQVPQTILQNDSHAKPELNSSWITPNTLPSYDNKAAFAELKQALLKQLESLSQNPSWWRAIASSVALPKTSLSLEDFANRYSEAANSFTIEQYQQRIDQLLIPASRQEVLIKL